MDISVVLVVLGAAFLHAFWNFQVRSTEDKALGMAAVMFGHLPLAIIGLVYVGLPPTGAWQYIFVSALCTGILSEAGQSLISHWQKAERK